MKKIVLLQLLLLLCVPTVAMADNAVISNEDFEKYSIAEVYSTQKMTVSYPGMAPGELSPGYIINAPGGLYEGSEAYEGNAAENIVTYAQTSDTEALAVPGGLDNGWHGRYTHPMLFVQGGQGASSEFNRINRRIAVVNDGGSKALNICPVNSAYVSTGCWYGYDEIDFQKPVVWDTDVKIVSMSDGEFTLSLTNGKMLDSKLFAYVTHEDGRSNITPILKFSPDWKLYIQGNEAGSFEKGKYYSVSIQFDATLENPKYSVIVTDKATGTTVAQQELTDINFDFSQVTGVEYFAKTVTNAQNVTEVKIDNINLYQLIFSGEIKSSAAVEINGKGLAAIDFSDNLDRDSLTEDSVKVYKGDTLIEGTSVSILNSKRIRLSLPILEPSELYTVKIRGIRSLGGIVADCTTTFRAKDIVTVSAPIATSDGITYNIKNNSSVGASVTALAVLYKEGKIVSDGVHYKRLKISAGETLTDTFTEIAEQETADSVGLYIIDDMRSFRAVAPQSIVIK